MPVAISSTELELPPPRWKAPGVDALTWASVWPRSLPFNSWAISAAERAESHYQRALAYLEEGDSERASVEFRNVFRLNPDHAEALLSYAELRRAEGYVADLGVDPSDDPAQKAWVIREHHCSVMRIAEEFPQVCDQELLLLRLTFPDCQVDRVHWRLQEGHSCGFRLRPSPQGAAAG